MIYNMFEQNNKNLYVPDALINKSDFKVGENYQGTNFHNFDLSVLNLDNCNFSNCFMLGVNLTSTSLCHANLIKVNLSHAKLKNTKLINADLSFANLDNANLEFADLESATILWTNFSNARLTHVNLKNSQISKGVFCNTTFHNINFKGSTIYGTNFQGSKFTQTNIHECDFQHTKALEISIAKELLADIETLRLNIGSRTQEIHPIVYHLFPNNKDAYFEASKLIPTMGLYFYDDKYDKASITTLLKLVASGQLSIYDENSISDYQKKNHNLV